MMKLTWKHYNSSYHIQELHEIKNYWSIKKSYWVNEFVYKYMHYNINTPKLKPTVLHRSILEMNKNSKNNKNILNS